MAVSRLAILLILSATLVSCFPEPLIESVGIVVDPTRPPTATEPIRPSETPSVTETAIATLESTPKTPALILFDQRKAMLDPFQSDVELFPDATRYYIDADIDFNPQANSASIDGMARILYTNRSGASLNSFVVMAWPNDRQYEAQMVVGPALVDGRLIEPVDAMEGIAFRYDLPRPLAVGDQVDASVPFNVKAGGPIGGPNPRRFGISEGVFFAPTFFPLVPRIDQDGWQLDSALPGGDTTNSDVAFFDVRLSFDPAYELAASGVEVERRREPDGLQVRYATGPMRDFAFALGSFVSGSREVDGTAVSVYVIADHAEDLPLVLDSASAQLRLLNERIGPYPYNELDLIDLPGAFGGIEYPGLVTVGTLGSTNVVDPTVHEVAHQWFYGLIGNDQINEPWLDEAIATFSQILYYEIHGPPTRASGMLSNFRSILSEHPEPGKPIGMEVRAYGSAGEYSLFVYLKGALFIERLRARLGEDQFYDFLQRYFQANRYGFVNGGEFQAVAEATCQCQLDDLFDLWVYEGGDPQLP